MFNKINDDKIVLIAEDDVDCAPTMEKKSAQNFGRQI